MGDELSDRLAKNLRELRVARGLTQQQMAKLSGVPRATWANLESSTANPTLAVLHRVALALRVPIEELLTAPPAEVKHYPKGSLPSRQRGQVMVSTLLPDRVPGVLIERMELASGGRLVCAPHAVGTSEYLTCESGEIELVAAGERKQLAEGDVAVFRGDQRHSYFNSGRHTAVGYSVVMLAPVVHSLSKQLPMTIAPPWRGAGRKKRAERARSRVQGAAR